MSDDHDPDAVVIIHHPPDGAEPYGIGPFPDLPGLIDAILANPRCGCRLQALWVKFPAGITMAIGVDMEAIVTMAADAIFGPSDVERDRLN